MKGLVNGIPTLQHSVEVKKVITQYTTDKRQFDVIILPPINPLISLQSEHQVNKTVFLVMIVTKLL